jgi:uncharacterized protein YjiS (DUF1127 family)
MAIREFFQRLGECRQLIRELMSYSDANALRAGNDVHRLQRLDDRLLADVGIARADIDGTMPDRPIRRYDSGKRSPAPDDVAGFPDREVHASVEPAPATAS